MRNEHDMMHGRPYERHRIRGWYASEKFRGIRVRWCGSALWTRQGNRVPAPDWFIEGLPAGVELDAELWAGRLPDETVARLAAVNGMFDERHGLQVFDSPDAPGDWRDRIAFARGTIAAAPHARVVGVWRAGFHSQNMAALARLQADGAEGFIAVRPGAGYVARRTADVIKVKHLLFA
jgi:DNA ligase-1